MAFSFCSLTCPVSNIAEQVTTTVQSFILKWLCMSLKFQLSKKISSLNLNRLNLIRLLDVREVRDRLFIKGVCVYVCVWEGRGGSSGAGANRVGVIPFCAIENEGLHKILQPFLKGHVFFCIPISILQKRNNNGGINNTLNIVFYQNDGIPNQHNMVLAVVSP